MLCPLCFSSNADFRRVGRNDGVIECHECESKSEVPLADRIEAAEYAQVVR